MKGGAHRGFKLPGYGGLLSSGIMQEQLSLLNDLFLGNLEDYNVNSYIDQVKSFWQETKKDFLKLANCSNHLSSEEFFNRTRQWEDLFKTIQEELYSDDNCFVMRIGSSSVGYVAARILSFRDIYSYFFDLVYIRNKDWPEKSDDLSTMIDRIFELEYLIESDLPGVTRINSAKPPKMMKSTSYKQLLFELKLAYLDPTTRSWPWILAFSGGKDSTLVAKAVYEMLLALPEYKRIRPIHICSVDTGLEVPLIIDHINENLNELAEYARARNLPISAHRLQPDIGQRYFSLLIGLGYLPTSRGNVSRWCTVRLKIRPMQQKIAQLAGKDGKVITVLGSREDESTTRQRSIKKHSVGSFRYNEKTVRKKSGPEIVQLVYQPIRYFDAGNVWSSLERDGGFPWGLGYSRMKKLYRESSGECPIVLDTGTPSGCGSRWGCMLCTAITDDKSLKSFIAEGNQWLQPIYDFRNYILKLASNPEMRESYPINRSTGRIMAENGPGGFNKKARRLLFSKLIELRDVIALTKPTDIDYQVISDEEIQQIIAYWKIVDNLRPWSEGKQYTALF